MMKLKYIIECSSSPLNTDLIGTITFKSESRALQFAYNWTKGTNRFIRVFYSGPDVTWYGVPPYVNWYAYTIQHGMITFKGGIS